MEHHVEAVRLERVVEELPVAGEELLAVVGLLVRGIVGAQGGVQAALLSATGKIMFAMIASGPRSRAVSNSYVNAYDVATGKLLGLVQTVRYATENPGFSSDTSGQYVLVYPAERTFFQELDLVTGRLVTVSVPQQGVPFAAAW